jgi:hypothetical protein
MTHASFAGNILSLCGIRGNMIADAPHAWHCHFMILRLTHTAAFAFLLIALPSFADAAVPPGFRKGESAPGITVWQKRNDLIQSVALSAGAKLSMLQGKEMPSENQTLYKRNNVKEWWNEWKQQEKNAFSIINGQFFNMDDPEKAPIAFPVKSSGFVHPGYGDSAEYNGKKMLLRIADDGAVIEPYNDSAAALYAAENKDAIVGLKADAPKQPGRRIGRTFIGVDDNGDAIIFTSAVATQRYATRILMAFGADRKQIIMLDGGKSTQAMINGKLVVPSTKRAAAGLRTVPQAIGVIAAE